MRTGGALGDPPDVEFNVSTASAAGHFQMIPGARPKPQERHGASDEQIKKHQIEHPVRQTGREAKSRRQAAQVHAEVMNRSAPVQPGLVNRDIQREPEEQAQLQPDRRVAQAEQAHSQRNHRCHPEQRSHGNHEQGIMRLGEAGAVPIRDGHGRSQTQQQCSGGMNEYVDKVSH